MPVRKHGEDVLPAMSLEWVSFSYLEFVKFCNQVAYLESCSSTLVRLRVLRSITFWIVSRFCMSFRNSFWFGWNVPSFFFRGIILIQTRPQLNGQEPNKYPVKTVTGQTVVSGRVWDSHPKLKAPRLRHTPHFQTSCAYLGNRGEPFGFQPIFVLAEQN